MKRERMTPFQEEICKKFTLWIIEKDLYLILILNISKLIFKDKLNNKRNKILNN